MNKTLKVMSSAALLAGVVAPVAVTTVSANSENIVTKVVSLDDNYKWKSGQDATTSIYIDEDDVNFTTGDTFILRLPSGVKWVKDSDQTGAYKKGSFISNSSATVQSSLTNGEYGYEIVSVTDQDLELKIAGVNNNSRLFGTADNNGVDQKDGHVEVPLYLEVDGADDGEIQLTVDGRQSTLTSGKYTVAYVNDGATNATIADVETIGDGDGIETIRIDETSMGAMYDANNLVQEVKLKLPNHFSWKAIDTNGDTTDVDTSSPFTNVTLGGGFSSDVVSVTDVRFSDTDEDELVVELTFLKASESPGTIYFENLAIDADNDADFGEVEVDVDGDEVTSQSLVVADYQEYGTSASLEDDVPTLIAGRNNADTEDLETVEFELKEATTGSWLPGRSVEIEFPTWVKVVGVDVTEAKNFDRTNNNGSYTSEQVADLVISPEIKGDDNTVEFDLPGDLLEKSKKSLKMKFYISTKADASGDVAVKVGGRAGIELAETVIAKVVSPISVEVKKADVRTGIKAQPVEDIVITENVAGAFDEDGKQVSIWLPDDVEFTSDPTITVEEGNLEIDEDSISVDDNYLTFDIDSESTRASKIKISGLKLDLDRSVAEGDIPVKFGGTALVQNDAVDDDTAFDEAVYEIGDKDYGVQVTDAQGNTTTEADFELTSKIDVGEFDQAWTVKSTLATVTTPAEGNATAEEVKLVIGSDKMMVGDKEVTLDAAPFVEASTGRTYLPLRAIAEALGANSVDWSGNTATVVKGGLVAQMTIGANNYVLNGAKVGMDGKAQIVNGRTVLPIRALGQALGADVQWDEATKTVTIK